jgi:hypothetical protein
LQCQYVAARYFEFMASAVIELNFGNDADNFEHLRAFAYFQQSNWC